MKQSFTFVVHEDYSYNLKCNERNMLSLVKNTAHHRSVVIMAKEKTKFSRTCVGAAL